MQEIKVYELIDLISVVTVHGEVLQNKHPEPIRIIQQSQSDDLEENILPENSMAWLTENKLLGDFGEMLALKYFKANYKEVIHTAENASLGYDLKVLLENNTYLCVEVKTSLNNWGFHISYNELKQTTIIKDSSCLLFIHVNFKQNSLKMIQGYLIINPIDYFKINFDTLTTPTINEVASVTPNKFYFELNKSHLSSLTNVIDLTAFTKEDDLKFLMK